MQAQHKLRPKIKAVALHLTISTYGVGRGSILDGPPHICFPITALGRVHTEVCFGNNNFFLYPKNKYYQVIINVYKEDDTYFPSMASGARSPNLFINSKNGRRVG